MVLKGQEKRSWGSQADAAALTILSSQSARAGRTEGMDVKESWALSWGTQLGLRESTGIEMWEERSVSMGRWPVAMLKVSWRRELVTDP